MRIDAHHHLWDLSAVNYPWLNAQGVRRFFGDPTPIQRNYLAAEFMADAKAWDVRGSVHIQVGAADGQAETDWVAEAAAENPGFPAAHVAFCDLSAPDSAAHMDRLIQTPIVRGVRQIVGRAPGLDGTTETGRLLDDPAFNAGLAAAAARGLSFDLQLIPEQMTAAAATFARHPDLPVILCHAGSLHDRSSAGLAAWRRDLAALAALPHAVCKLSGLGMFDHDWTPDSIRSIARTVFDLFGPDRVMVGSNFPVDSLYSSYGAIWEAYEEIFSDQTAVDRERLFYFTALRTYRLDMPLPLEATPFHPKI